MIPLKLIQGVGTTTSQLFDVRLRTGLQAPSGTEHLHLLSPKDVVEQFSPKEVLGQFSPKEVLGQFSPEAIEKYLAKLKKP